MVYNWLINGLTTRAQQNCALCGQNFKTHIPSRFCPDCNQDLPKISPACCQCGINLPTAAAVDPDQGSSSSSDTIGPRCGPCLTEPPAYDRVISTFAYAEPIKQLIAHFKYQRQLAVGAMLAELLSADVLSSPRQIEAILPVPLHPSRLRQRGFNQALELARPLARALRLPLLRSSIHRQKNTLEQSSLSSTQRRTNLNKAFVLEKEIPYRSIAIVDDVMTTGSTVEELSSLLKQNGVEYVEVWCVARASK